MRKIGILTYHFADNFGAVLQCYALKEVISEYEEVEIIDYKPEYINNMHKVIVNPFKIKNLTVYNKFKLLVKHILPLNIYRTTVKKMNFMKFRKKELPLSEKTFKNAESFIKKIEDYRCIVVGSDQVWNPELQGEIDKMYFLNFGKKYVKRVSYAASIGKPEVSEKYLNDFIKSINKFDAISVREERSERFISKIVENKVEVTLDPTLLLDKSRWVSISEPADIKQEYILVYDLENTNDITEIVNELSNKLKLPVVTYSNKNIYHNKVESFSNYGPAKFLGLFKDASYVVTNSFHGTVFSVIFEKKFITIPHTTRGNRMEDFLYKLNLEGRIVKEKNDLESVNYKDNINFSIPNKILECEKEKSLSYLKKSLEI
ncbi:polysaccharide pyruvyl transferase family protein [Salinicoccus roseus]|uniref:polysaccharide pyruvyl transferase family protein n=1 Tax=Salinicoccus roseus TaxID=45670 RepID=UPI001CA7B655|nr:polysaccharide pyruvyl transferase family protein [Salinicoccus roseus]MBY8908370.1 polysaccharide pyruvyl transferase family protein [Salinicoccus roseus]